MKLTEFMNERYKNREDKDNIFGVGVSDTEFKKFIIDYLLGEDWYVVDPLGPTQINEVALYSILKKYSKRYRQELKAFMEASVNNVNIYETYKEIEELKIKDIKTNTDHAYNAAVKDCLFILRKYIQKRDESALNERVKQLWNKRVGDNNE